MTRNEFEMGIEDLQAVYGAAKYPEARTSAMWDRLKDVGCEEYMAVVRTFIASSTHPPLLKEFELCLKVQLDNLAKIKKENIEKTFTECVRCDNRGLVYVKRKHEKLGHTYEYVYKCTCARGQNLFPAYPSITTIQGLQ